MHSRQFAVPLIVLCAVASFAACSRHDEETAVQQVDRAMARAQQQTDEARADAKRAVGDAQKAADTAGAKVAAAITDATITTAINTELARDPGLDPAKIDVDTSQGRVVLRGSAPDDQAKERAKRIALSVGGVRGVDNYLTVGKKS